MNGSFFPNRLSWNPSWNSNQPDSQRPGFFSSIFNRLTGRGSYQQNFGNGYGGKNQKKQKGGNLALTAAPYNGGKTASYTTVGGRRKKTRTNRSKRTRKLRKSKR